LRQGLVFFALALGCDPGVVPAAMGATPVVPKDAPAVFGAWSSTSFGAYLAPSSGFVGADGGVDLVFHFHGARLADQQWRSTRLPAVVVDADFGGVSGAFSDAMGDPERFGRMQSEVLGLLRKRTGVAELYVRRLAVLSFSAGYAAISRILAEPSYAERIDAVILLDSLHAPYVDPIPAGASEHGIPFRHLIDRRALDPFVRFGRQASLGHKLMVVTHSDVLPPDYGSTTETAFTLAVSLDARLQPRDARNALGMWASDASDARDFHIRGYWGATPEAHLEHLHLLGDVVREFLIPRWTG
jgi:hypothetical protein